MPAACVGGVKTAVIINGTPACEAEAGLSSRISPSPLAHSLIASDQTELHNALLVNSRGMSN